MTEPLILLPGMLCDAALWEQQISALDPSVESRVPFLEGTTIREMAERVLDQAPPRFAITGHSMGGYVALEVLHLAPQRVTRLALINSSASADTEKQAIGRARAIALAQAGPYSAIVDSLLPLLVHHSQQDDAALLEAVSAMLMRAGPDTFIRQQRATAGRADHSGDVSGSTIPVLLIAGAQDRIVTPDDCSTLAANVPAARFLLLDHVGHLAPMERPAVVSDALRAWLQVD